MATSSKLGATYLEEGGQGLELESNDFFLLLDAAASVGFKVEDRDLNTPPGSPAAGVIYIVGSIPTGDWSGQAGKIAIYDGSEWKFITASTTMAAWIVDEKIWIAYDTVEGEWYALQPIWTTTEIWTGKFRDGSKVYTKVVDFGALPNATSKNVAHGISNLDLSYTQAPVVEATCSNGTMPTTLAGIATVTFTGTNLTLTTTADFTAYSAYVRIEYCKTA